MVFNRDLIDSQSSTSCMRVCGWVGVNEVETCVCVCVFVCVCMILCVGVCIRGHP